MIFLQWQCTKQDTWKKLRNAQGLYFISPPIHLCFRVIVTKTVSLRGWCLVTFAETSFSWPTTIMLGYIFLGSKICCGISLIYSYCEQILNFLESSHLKDYVILLSHILQHWAQKYELYVTFEFCSRISPRL